jgi:hypothetical protein
MTKVAKVSFDLTTYAVKVKSGDIHLNVDLPITRVFTVIIHLNPSRLCTELARIFHLKILIAQIQNTWCYARPNQ